ncbi:NUDIX hydrolase [Nocardioides aquiterrae]|uniref:NUDIX hydrolase n=1 Tax=Nocardioides aquiterrae TaxID=203799 RepID=UPI0031D74B7C
MITPVDPANDLVVKSLNYRGRNITYVDHPGTAGCLVYDARRLKILLVNQFRPVLSRDTLEIPSGIIEQDESPQTTATRETLEETGYQVFNLRPLVALCSSVGLTTEVVHLFWSRDFTRTGANPETGIDISWLSIDDALAAAMSSPWVDAKTLAGLLTLQNLLTRPDGLGP